ncbi:hypothetical protein NPIL_665221 [Nephila pilipes]|uniref:Uncharacterized protein n=1 Tax=Nephila pilipes TaxID=299642 RepID=A0A8X6IJ48_NEPPI|nr:hypothetical protein NPIL_665221 [Nephila pilipes]
MILHQFNDNYKGNDQRKKKKCLWKDNIYLRQKKSQQIIYKHECIPTYEKIREYDIYCTRHIFPPLDKTITLRLGTHINHSTHLFMIFSTSSSAQDIEEEKKTTEYRCDYREGGNKVLEKEERTAITKGITDYI